MQSGTCNLDRESVRTPKKSLDRSIDLSQMWDEWEPERPELLITLVPTRPRKVGDGRNE